MTWSFQSDDFVFFHVHLYTFLISDKFIFFSRLSKTLERRGRKKSSKWVFPRLEWSGSTCTTSGYLMYCLWTLQLLCNANKTTNTSGYASNLFLGKTFYRTRFTNCIVMNLNSYENTVYNISFSMTNLFIPFALHVNTFYTLN